MAVASDCPVQHLQELWGTQPDRTGCAFVYACERSGDLALEFFVLGYWCYHRHDTPKEFLEDESFANQSPGVVGKPFHQIGVGSCSLLPGTPHRARIRVGLDPLDTEDSQHSGGLVHRKKYSAI